MLNFTKEEKRVILFLSGFAFCGLIFSQLIKLNAKIEKIIYPQTQLAKINLNQISLEELISFKCMPIKLAEEIINYRSFNQGFSSLEQLKDVKGIGDKRYEKLKEIFFIS